MCHQSIIKEGTLTTPSPSFRTRWEGRWQHDCPSCPHPLHSPPYMKDNLLSRLSLPSILPPPSLSLSCSPTIASRPSPLATWQILLILASSGLVVFHAANLNPIKLRPRLTKVIKKKSNKEEIERRK